MSRTPSHPGARLAGGLAELNMFAQPIACTVPYRLSEAEAHRYKSVTDDVREEFNRAGALANDKRAGTVGFALTILQRRLASSPEAILQPLRRHRERMESRLRELEISERGGKAAPVLAPGLPALDAEDVEDIASGRIYQYGPGCVRDSNALRAALALLEERGARAEQQGRHRFVVMNPALVDQFEAGT